MSSKLPSDAQEEFLRHENYGLAQLEVHARSLNDRFPVVPVPRGTAIKGSKWFRERLNENAERIANAYQVAATDARLGLRITPPAEWLLDNYYVVEEQVREIRDHLPDAYVRELPKLQNGEPRVYALARELLLHTDSAVDEPTLDAFLTHFQSQTSLTIGETWAVPIMLRLVLVEDLRQAAERLLAAKTCRDQTKCVIEKFAATGEWMVDDDELVRCALALTDRLEQADRAMCDESALQGLRGRLRQAGNDLDELIRLEHQRQAAEQVTVGNIITSMRLIAAIDWVGFFERTNRAESVLRDDAVRVYAQMDFQSRNLYRNAVERLSKRYSLDDVTVAQAAVELGLRMADCEPLQDARRDLDRMRHVGYWLIDEGLPQLDHLFGQLTGRSIQELCAAEVMRATKQLPRTPPGTPRLTYWLYFGGFAAVNLVLVALLVLAGWRIGLVGSVLGLIALLAIVPISETALSLINAVVTHWVRPRLLPKLKFDEGIPPEYPTIVVVPSMLTSDRDVESLVAQLENHHVSNSDRALRFALLTDFADAPESSMPTDQELLALAIDRIDSLNERYGHDGKGPFYLFHRKRIWNPAESCWMGWERKRGKLMEFGRWLQGSHDTTYETQVGDVAGLAVFRDRHATAFVITLDGDTILPRNAARRLVGTLAHPLNRPRMSADGTRVERGYSILQPRVSMHLAGAQRTRYVEIFSSNPGLDPYVTAASDVYQDLFGEGSFTGKGIFDLEAFERAVGEAFPENSILSHDLIEGCHARVALVSDIEVFDGYPHRYDADMERSHRWVRGDWQIAPWLFPWVPYASGRKPNPLSWLSRWKILDNLRRSLVAPLLLVWMIVGWLVAPAAAWLWTVAATLVVATPLVIQFFSEVVRLPRARSVGERMTSMVRELRTLTERCLWDASFLPHRGLVMLDAIVRTLWRMGVTRRHLLEWETASASETRLSRSGWTLVRQMWIAPALTIACGILLADSARIAAAPFLAIWLIAPVTALLMSRPRPLDQDALTARDRRYLRSLASSTWAFFEVFVDKQSNWLPPDNVQEYPHEKIACRISPTNEGLFLLSTLVARDFGWLSLLRLIEFWEGNTWSWRQLERVHGHWLNWYDTQTLNPLPPRYVSTVDSGNLLACFLTMRAGIVDLGRAPVLGPRQLQGLRDTLDWYFALVTNDPATEPGAAGGSTERESVPHRPRPDGLPSAGVARLQRLVEQLDEAQRLWRAEAICEMLWQCRDSAQEIEQSSAALKDDPTSIQLSRQLATIAGRLRQLAKDADELMAWLPRSVECDELFRHEMAWQEVSELLARPSLLDLCELPRRTRPYLDRLATDKADDASARDTLTRLAVAIRYSAAAAESLWERLQTLSEWFERSALEMDFKFLFNDRRDLFSIGCNIETRRLDRSHYDILCSEARLASYLAIAKGDAPAEHWLRLGRQTTLFDGQPTLLSWGGTMFEYLLPPVFHRHFEGSLLTTSCRAAVRRQEQYGVQRHVPWGTSESAFSAVASNTDYHYRSFGVPGLGLKRGLAKDLVVSPYSTLLALPLEMTRSLKNLRYLDRERARGTWGYFDAVDYTPNRLRRGRRSVLVQCYMAHHQGMSLAALANVLDHESIQRRFHAHPLVRANELLLQERAPSETAPISPHSDEVDQLVAARPDEHLLSRRIRSVHTRSPRTQLLSNGQFSVMVTHAGGGYSRYRDLAVTRWQSDATRDNWGQFIYLRDVTSGELWSPTYQPTCVELDDYEVTFSLDKAEFMRRQGDLESVLEVTVSPENNADVRQLRLTNHGSYRRQIVVTSYAEVTLNTPAADLAHPAFGKLFVETEFVPEIASVIARRRPRDSTQQVVMAIHTIAVPDEAVETLQFETSRCEFLGRGGTTQRPRAVDLDHLSGTVGPVLDPVFALRCQVEVRPGESVTIGFTTAIAESHDQALSLGDHYSELRGISRALELAWAFAQAESRHPQLTPSKFHLCQRLAAMLLFPTVTSGEVGPADDPPRPTDGQRGLWRLGISGDLPILLASVTGTEEMRLVGDLVLAHRFLLSHGLSHDLVIVNNHPGSYLDALHEQLQQLITEMGGPTDPQQGRTHLLRGSQMTGDDHRLLESCADCFVRGGAGSLAHQIEQAVGGMLVQSRPTTAPPPPPLPPPAMAAPVELGIDGAPSNGDGVVASEFFNGIGGFVDDGRRYRLRVGAWRRPPTPWSNVIANSELGCLVTESGGGHTWLINSRENKLTTWANDPVSDPPSEMIYVRDDVDGTLWSPLPAGAAADDEYIVEHGQGFSRFLHVSHQIDHEVFIAVAAEDPVKFIRVRLKNLSRNERHVSVTYYAEWVLGVYRQETSRHLQTAIDRDSGALLARNPYHPTLPDQVVFLHVLARERWVTGDRREFIGRNGSLLAPAALAQPTLSGITGKGMDPCGAVQTSLMLAPGATDEVIFLLGGGRDSKQTLGLLDKYDEPVNVEMAIDQAMARWDDILQTIEVETPNRALDILVNRWLMYQTLGCRIWGRSALYQSSGAFGFRDQLQDVMAVVYSRPDVARQHILLAASRQYHEGDVQHWWHPPEGRGTRTRFSDDFLFLPFVVSHYIRVTGDSSILDEQVSFLNSPLLESHEHERYELPEVSNQVGSLYQHCQRAIGHGMQYGRHGLPLMGCGDWNDGMNKVGAEGDGESVWVGWFQCVVFEQFADLAQARGDDALAADYLDRAARLREEIDRHGWDGQWYRRAFFDDGTPLGSQENDECQIDSLTQSWAVIAGGDPARARLAMQSAVERLVRVDDRLVLLFAPPFDKTPLNPGYIKGYLPGIRENGGQYTHAATWLIQAATILGEGELAVRLLDVINPVHHTADAPGVDRYQVEPYVMAADVYSQAPHVGRGGWTWYTGTAAWTYRVIVESILGLRVEGDWVELKPVIPASWPRFSLTFRRGNSTHVFQIMQTKEDEAGISSDGELRCHLIDDGERHEYTYRIRSSRTDDVNLSRLVPKLLPGSE
jgi:cyclic beta-1,2-glucan synthetase